MHDYFTNLFYSTLLTSTIETLILLKTRIFHTKSVILLGLCLFLENDWFSSFLIVGFKVNYTVNMENSFLYVFSYHVCVT